MAEVTYYVALPFVASDDGVAAGEPTECINPVAVVMRAEALSRKEGHVGAVAFSRTGDPATGDFGDAKVIKKFGDVPQYPTSNWISVPVPALVYLLDLRKNRAETVYDGLCIDFRGGYRCDAARV
jgi:hypothetical protein